MPELDPLPPRPKAPAFAATADVFEAALAGGARRRRRSAAAGSATLAVAVVALLAWPSVGSPFSLRQDRLPPAVGASETPTPEPTPSVTPSPTDQPTATPDPTADAGSTASPSDDVLDPSPSDVSYTQQPDGSYVAHPWVMTRDTAPISDAACPTPSTDPINGTNGWCESFPGPFTTKTGATHDYAYYLCRYPGQGAGTITFYDRNEVDLQVSRNSRVEWSTAVDPSVPNTQHDVRVGDGQCARWHIAWDTTGNDGDLLPPATDYTLDATVAAASLSPNNGGVLGGSSSTGYNDSFTITP